MRDISWHKIYTDYSLQDAIRQEHASLQNVRISDQNLKFRLQRKGLFTLAADVSWITINTQEWIGLFQIFC
jgi:hypothetical protein